MNTKIFTFLVLVAISLYSWGKQLPENKMAELEKTSDKRAKVELLWEIIKDTHMDYPDTAIYFADKMGDLAKAIGNEKRYTNSVWAKAIIYRDRGALKNSATYLFEAHQLYKKANDNKNVAIALYNIGQVFQAGNDFTNALLYLERALNYYQSNGDAPMAAKAHYEMARCYIEIKDYEKSLTHLNQCLSSNDDKKNQSLTSKAHNYLGATYFKMKQYDRAIEEYMLSIEAARGLKDFKKKSAIAYNNIGEAYLYNDDLNNAGVYLQKALTLKDELGDPNFALSTRVLLSRLATKQQDYKKALTYLEEGIMVADKSVINTNLMDALDEVIALNERQTTVQIPTDQIISYFKFENQQANLLRSLNDELGSLNGRYVLKNAFETYQLSEANSNLTDQLSQSKVIIILIILLSLSTGMLSVYYVRKYLSLREFKQETTLGLELISHQLERTIKMASKK